MSGRKLKNFDLYIQKINLMVEASGLKVTYKELGTDAEYVPTRRGINVDNDLPQSNEVAALLHELGHHSDDSLLDSKYCAKLSKAYRAVYTSTPSVKQLALVLECENRAWNYAVGIAKQLKIPLGRWFYSYKELCIKDYEEKSQ